VKDIKLTYLLTYLGQPEKLISSRRFLHLLSIKQDQQQSIARCCLYLTCIRLTEEL